MNEYKVEFSYKRATGWTFVAHGIVQYEDGTIEWDYSSGGRFGEVPTL